MRLTLRAGLRGGLQVVHGVEQAALEHPGATDLAHDPDAGLGPRVGRRGAAVLVEAAGLAQGPAPLPLVLEPLGLVDELTAGL